MPLSDAFGRTLMYFVGRMHRSDLIFAHKLYKIKKMSIIDQVAYDGGGGRQRRSLSLSSSSSSGKAEGRLIIFTFVCED